MNNSGNLNSFSNLNSFNRVFLYDHCILLEADRFELLYSYCYYHFKVKIYLILSGQSILKGSYLEQ